MNSAAGLTENEVDARELLERLETDTSPRALSVLSLAVREACEPRSLADRALVVQVGRDLGEFLVDFLRVRVAGQDACESLAGLLFLVLEEEPAGRLGEHKETGREDDCGETSVSKSFLSQEQGSAGSQAQMNWRPIGIW